MVLAWARGVAGLTRLPVTEEIAGSNPVGPAIQSAPSKDGAFCMTSQSDLSRRSANKVSLDRRFVQD